MTKSIIIFGSSRDRGNTWSAISSITQYIDMPIINLSESDISEFDYEHRNKGDDFLKLIPKILNYDHIILATPIYWYSMSAKMKIFIDRWTDLLTIEKKLGRNFRGKSLSVISSYVTHPEGREGFEDQFKQIANYMGMRYQSCYFYYTGDNREVRDQNSIELNEFLKYFDFKVQKVNS